MKNRLIKYICLALVFSVLHGCTGKYEDYNRNHYEPSKVSPGSLLTEMFKVYANAQQNRCQQNNTWWASFSGHVAATGNWKKGDAIFAYFNANDAFNDGSWGDNFTPTSAGLNQIGDMTGKEGPVYAVALVTRVYAMHNLLSLYGPIPYTQIKPGATKNPYDDERTAWHALFDDLDKAISELSAGGTSLELSAVDQFYGGNLSKWKKFANTLKLRMAIRISGIEPDYARTKAEEAVASGVMEAVGDSSWDTTNSGEPNGYNMVGLGWKEVRSNACLTSCMNGYNDPRRAKYFTEQTVNGDGGYAGVFHGTAESGGPEPARYEKYSMMLCAMDREAPMPVMYAAEAAFLRAEGALKNWNMGGGAKDFYEKGIRLSFEEFGLTDGQAEDYMQNSDYRPAPYDDPKAVDSHAAMSDITIGWEDDGRELERVLTQKWIALYLDPLNGWSDFRRTGFPKIFMPARSADPTCDLTRGQRRLRFPQNEYKENTENVEEAVKMLSNGQDTNGTDLWWAMKSDGSY